MKLIKYISILFLALATSVVFAQEEVDVKFEVIVDKQEIGLSETFKVNFVINNDGDNFIPPNFEGFDIVKGPNRAITNKWINGKRSFSKTYTYSLKPKTTGDLKINQATIKVDDLEYKTKPIVISVSKQNNDSKKLNKPNDSIKNQIHIVSEVSKRNIKLEDSLTVTYRIYVSQDLGVSSWKEIKEPAYKNCTNKNIDFGELKIENTDFKGEKYRTVIWRKTILKPEKTGIIIINPVEMDFILDVPSNKRDIFGSRIMESETVTLKSNQVLVKVSE